MTFRPPRHYVALGVSIVFHGILFTISIPQTVSPVQSELPLLSIPVNVVITAESPADDTQATSTSSVKHKVVSAKSPASIVPMPGDRESPEITHRSRIPYPKAAINHDWEGKVTISVYLSSSGQVKTIKILRSSGHSVLDDIFVKTVRDQFKFKPRRVQGHNREGVVTLSHKFAL